MQNKSKTINSQAPSEQYTNNTFLITKQAKLDDQKLERAHQKPSTGRSTSKNTTDQSKQQSHQKAQRIRQLLRTIGPKQACVHRKTHTYRSKIVKKKGSTRTTHRKLTRTKLMSEKHTLINPRRVGAGKKLLEMKTRERERADGASWSGKETEIKRLGAFVGIRGEKLG